MKLILVGAASVHIVNFYKLIKPLFSEVVIVTNGQIEVDCQYEIVSFSFKPGVYLKRLTYQKAFYSLAKKFGPDVVHIHQANTTAKFIFNALKKYPVNTVLTTWGSDVLLLPNRSWLFKKMVTQNLMAANFITADANAMKVAVEQLTNNKKSAQLINFGVEDALLKQQMPKQNIIFSNRAHKPLYRIDLLLKSFINYLKLNENTSWQLVIANTGPQTTMLKDLAKPYKNNIKFVDFLSSHEQKEYYGKAKFFVSIPESDGTAVSLLEAMACGCYPILSNLAANKQWIRNDENGSIVEPSNLSNQWINILSLSNEKLQEVAIKNKKIIEKSATKSVIRQKFNTIYKSLVSHG